MRLLFPLFTLCAVTLIATAGLLLWIGDTTTAARAAPAYDSETIGGINYLTRLSNEIDPSSAADKRFVRRMPAAERRVPKGEVLFGVFVARTNATDATLPSASRVDLIDGVGRAYRPLRLSAKNPYTYRAGTIPPGGWLPAPGTPAANDIEAAGQLLLYRVPARDVGNGWFELVVHDPLHPGDLGHVQL